MLGSLIFVNPYMNRPLTGDPLYTLHKTQGVTDRAKGLIRKLHLEYATGCQGLILHRSAIDTCTPNLLPS